MLMGHLPQNFHPPPKIDGLQVEGWTRGRLDGREECAAVEEHLPGRQAAPAPYLALMAKRTQPRGLAHTWEMLTGVGR